MSSPANVPVGIVAPSYTWGRGYAQLSVVPIPAAGSAAKLTIPGTAFQRLLAAHFTLTTSAVVANRFPRVSFVDGDGTVRARFTTSVAVVAASVVTYTFAVNQGDHSHVATGDGYSSIPDMILSSGYGVLFDAAGLDIGDQISAVDIFMDWFWTGPQGLPQGVGQTRSYDHAQDTGGAALGSSATA